MTDQAGTGFAAGERAWLQRQGTLRQVVRQELVTRQLLAHLPPGAGQVLDVGCGQGTQVLALARRGHRVTGLDRSATLLTELQQALAEEPAEVQERVATVPGDVGALATLFGAATFDAVLCHGVLMYFPDPRPVLAALAEVVAPGGLVSLLVRNGDALALRAGLAGDWHGARQAFEGLGYTNRLGVEARADRLADLTGAVQAEGLRVEAWYGVRVLTDLVADDAPVPAEIDLILDCEERAGRTDPYRSVAALTHLIARRPPASRPRQALPAGGETRARQG